MKKYTKNILKSCAKNPVWSKCYSFYPCNTGIVFHFGNSKATHVRNAWKMTFSHHGLIVHHTLIDSSLPPIINAHDELLQVGLCMFIIDPLNILFQ